MDEYYAGSKLLTPLSDKIGLSVDKLNFVCSQLIALCIAFLMRIYLHPKNTTPTVRHIFSFVVGISLSYFCFGYEIWHLLILATVCYLIMEFQSVQKMQYTVFVLSMGYLATIHAKRQIFSYGAYTLDITGPLMVMVQRISGVAFSLHDGLACDIDNLSDFRKKYLTKKRPTIIEYFGYLFQFQSLLAGPYIFFEDYLQFIDGTNFKKAKRGDDSEPSPVNTVIQKFIGSIICIVISLTIAPYFPIDKARESSFVYEWHPIYQILYLLTCTTLTRFMYYHAWILAEAVCNASGLGFNGYDEKGNAKWDLASNVNVIKFELCDNIRNGITYWNTGTNAWLRFVVYERMSNYQKYKTMCTFLLSAVWHGFYPGYYVCFTTAAITLSAARNARKILRPYFLGSTQAKLAYDIVGFILTKLSYSYFTFPFIIYEFWPAVVLYKSTYFHIHVLSFVALFILPAVCKYLPKPPAAVVS